MKINKVKICFKKKSLKIRQIRVISVLSKRNWNADDTDLADF